MSTVTHDPSVSSETQKPIILGISIAFVIASTTVVALRLYTRARIIKMVGADDITIVIAQVLAIGSSISTILEAVWGLGIHSWMADPADTMKELKSLYTNVLVYNAAQTLVKISLLIMYRRVFQHQWTQVVCFWLLVFIITWGVTQEIVAGLACQPLSVIRPQMTGHCITSLPVWYLTSSMNIATDFIIFSTPLPAILRLQMQTRQKVLLATLFSLGFFTCVISLIRISTLHKASNTTDPNWDNSPAAYWSALELNCGILCASLPCLRPLISGYVPSFLSTHTSHNNTTTSTKLSTVRQSKSSRSGAEEPGIYVRRDVELRKAEEGGYPDKGSLDSSDEATGVTAHGSMDYMLPRWGAHD